jgi:hypothetical protein
VLLLRSASALHPETRNHISDLPLTVNGSVTRTYTYVRQLIS